MPSGSHSSGGGGSHFGGGSSGGSHFGGSSRSSGGFIRRSRPGTAVIVLNGKQYEVYLHGIVHTHGRTCPTNGAGFF